MMVRRITKRAWSIGKIVILCLAVALSVLTGGCMSYHDTDKMTYVTSMLLDVTKDKKAIIYFETFIPIRSASKEASEASRRIFAVKADTVSQCLYHLRTLTNFYVTLSHCKVLFITENAVNAGLKNYVDGFIREQDFVNRTRFAIYNGTVDDYRNLQFNNEKLTGLYVFDLLEENYPISMGTRADLLTFVNQCASDTHIIALPRLSIRAKEMDNVPSTLHPSEGHMPSGGQSSSDGNTSERNGGNQSSGAQFSGGGQKGGMGVTTGGGSGSLSQMTTPTDVECEVEGITFADKDRLISSLSLEDSLYYNFMTSHPDFGIIVVPNPEAKGKYVTLGILHSGNGVSSTYEKGIYHYRLNIKVKAMFAEAQDRIDLNDQTIEAIERSAEGLLKKRCESLFKRYKEKNEDIFWIQDTFNRLYPKEKKTKIIGKTDLKVDFHIEITSTHKAADWR